MDPSPHTFASVQTFANVFTADSVEVAWDTSGYGRTQSSDLVPTPRPFNGCTIRLFSTVKKTCLCAALKSKKCDTSAEVLRSTPRFTASNVFEKIFIGVFKTAHATISLHPGVVREPSYVQNSP